MCISKIICIDKGPCNREKNCQIGVRMRHKLFFFVSGCLYNGISKLERIRKGKMKFLVR